MGREEAHPVGDWIPWATVLFKIMKSTRSVASRRFFRLWWKSLTTEHNVTNSNWTFPVNRVS
jgi:hypothetical protein